MRPPAVAELVDELVCDLLAALSAALGGDPTPAHHLFARGDVAARRLDVRDRVRRLEEVNPVQPRNGRVRCTPPHKAAQLP